MEIEIMTKNIYFENKHSLTIACRVVRFIVAVANPCTAIAVFLWAPHRTIHPFVSAKDVHDGFDNIGRAKFMYPRC